jgi:hypothetical protein
MTTLPAPVVSVGKIKTFGLDGPKYEITAVAHLAANGEWLVPIRVIVSGEELDYRHSRFVLDPEVS